MRINYNDPPKSLSPAGAKLITSLYDRNRQIFQLSEAQEIIGQKAVTANLLSQLVRRGVINRLKGGVFRIVPFDLGSTNTDLGNPHVVARELALIANEQSGQGYYLSHGSAFAIHQLVTQPQLIVYVSSPRMLRSRTIQGTEFRFVTCKSKAMFGISEMWIDKSEQAKVSDLEKTLLDGLKQPAYCGGISEVAKAFSIKRQAINTRTIVEYALKLNIGAVIRRLGYIMELYQIGNATDWNLLRKNITQTYQLLDPELPAEGKFIANWRLRLNITEEELQAIRGT